MIIGDEGVVMNAKDVITHEIVTVNVFDTVVTAVKLTRPIVNVIEYVPTSDTVFVRTVKVVPSKLNQVLREENV